MLKKNLFYLYLNYIICNDFIKEDMKLIEIKNIDKNKNKSISFYNKIKKKYNQTIKSQRYYYNSDCQNFEYQDSEFKDQKLKFKDQRSNILFFMTKAYDNALKCILPYINAFIDQMQNYPVLHLYLFSNKQKTKFINNFLEILTKNSNISLENMEILKKIFTFDYFFQYTRYVLFLLSLNEKNKTFNDFFQVENIEDNIELCFYKFSKFVVKTKDDLSKNDYINRFHLLNITLNSNINFNMYNIQNMFENNIVLYLFSPYFIYDYIYHKFVFYHFSEIYNFWKKKFNKQNTSNNNEFELRDSSILFRYSTINYEISSNIFKINDNDETIQIEKIINLKLLSINNEIIKTPLITKNNLKILYKKDSYMLPLVLTAVDKKSL